MLTCKKYRFIWMPLLVMALFLASAAPVMGQACTLHAVQWSPAGSALPAAVVGQPYSGQVTAACLIGGCASFGAYTNIGSLPSGLGISSGGLISGTPTAAGTYGFTIRVTENCSPGGQNFSNPYSITATCPSMSITSTSPLTSGTVGSPYNYQLTATGRSPITFTMTGGELPQGLTVSSAGLISGTPTTSGNNTFTIQATDSCSPTPQSTSKAFSLTVSAPSVSVTGSVSITSFSVPSNITTTQGLTYTFTTTPAASTTMTSSQGTFQVGGSTIGTNPSQISANVINGSGSVSETITVLPSVIQQALARGSSIMTYNRTFTNGTNTVTTQVIISIISISVTGSVSITSYSVPSNITTTQGLTYTFTTTPAGSTMMTSSQGTFQVGEITIGTSPSQLSANVINGSGSVSETITVLPSVIQQALARGSSIMTYNRTFTNGTNTVITQVTISITSVSVAGSVSVSSYSVPSTITTTQGITYTFTTTPASSTTMTSTQGTFQVGGTTIGTNPSQISASVVSGRGSVSETITVLPSVIQQALARGSSSMSYNRTFTNGTNTVTTQVTISITSEAGANLLITRMQLYFQNRMPVITIKRSDPMLKAYVDINYVGSGFLEGYWEVDGNLITNVKQSITTGRTVTIESPSPPVLSTFIPGEHQVRFVVTSPSQNIPFPQINYYVTPEETAVKKLASLDLLSPNDQGAIDYEPTTFLWNRSEGISTYFLQFFLKGEEKPVFSAYARNPAYRLPDAVIKTFFSRGKTYAWKVKGLDSSNITAAESPLFIFSIRE